MKPMNVDFAVDSSRRRWLQLTALGAATTLWLPRSAWAQTGTQAPRFTGNPFALGVASGSPASDGVVLWTRLVNLSEGTAMLPVTVQWEVADDEAFARIVQRGQAQALPELAHSVHVEAQGLEPDRWYFYRFMVGDAVSAAGRTRTFPAPDAVAKKLRIAYASCQRWEHGYYAAWRHMREENLDAVLFLGDYIYEYGGAKDAVRDVSGGVTLTLDDYRARYALHKSEPELQAMHAACPWLVEWDDHEVQNDYAGLAPGSGPVSAAGMDFTARRAAAYQAYYEHMPLRASVLTRSLQGLEQGAETRIYGSVPFGRLATFHLLDDRQYRSPEACVGKPGSGMVDPATCDIWNDPKRTLLGTTQEQWLDKALEQAAEKQKALKRGEGNWQILGMQTLFGQRDSRPGPGQLFWTDGWDGYAPARQRFTETLQRHQVQDVVMLGGDVHENWVGHIKADYDDPKSAALGVEFCGTSITSRSGGDNTKVPKWLAENPHFVFGDTAHRGYGVVEFTPKQLTTTLRVVDDVAQRDSGISTLAKFEVQAGRPVIEKV